jgi:hypothetical protein
MCALCGDLSIIAHPSLGKEKGMAQRERSKWSGRWFAGLVVTLLALGAGIGLHPGHAQAPRPGGWLGALPAEKQTEAIDRQLRGFDLAMMEVNYRYTDMYFGAMEGNWDYALYTGEKIAWALENGFERRANGEAIFLRGPYPLVLDAIKKKDIALFKQRFDSLRAACNACHAAEAVAFIKVGIPVIKQTPLVNN